MAVPTVLTAGGFESGVLREPIETGIWTWMEAAEEEVRKEVGAIPDALHPWGDSRTLVTGP